MPDTVTMSSPSNNNTQATSPTTTVILFGKIGHGKTCILNKICGARFVSQMSSQSCTRTLQRGKSSHYGMIVIDTPGFYATDDVKHHTWCQTEALSKNGELSGIYVVVKYARCSDMAETVNKIMDFVGDDGEEYIRVIITHVDTVEKQEFNAEETMAGLAHLLDIPPHHIVLTGNTKHGDMTTDNSRSATSVEEFIHATLHPRPRMFQVSNDQLGCIANLCVGARKFKQAIEDVRGKIEAATVACHALMKSSSSPHRSHIDYATFGQNAGINVCRHGAFALHVTRHATKSMVHDARGQLNRQGGQELTPEELKILTGKLDSLLYVSLETFLIQTDFKCASSYSKKRYGYLSLEITYRKKETFGNDWKVVYHLNDQEIPVSNVVSRLNEFCFEQTAQRAKRKSRDENKMETKHKKNRVMSPYVLPSFGDSRGRNAPRDDIGVDKISPCTPPRQKKSSCSHPGRGTANNQDQRVPTLSCCNCLSLLFSLLFISEFHHVSSSQVSSNSGLDIPHGTPDWTFSMAQERGSEDVVEV